MTVTLDLDSIEAPSEPSLIFTLDGREWRCRNRLAVPAHVADAILGAVSMPLGDIYRGVLIPEDGDDFVALISRPDTPFDLARATKFIETLVEVIFNRPTQPSATSGSGRRATKGTSSASSSSQGTRSRKRAS